MDLYLGIAVVLATLLGPVLAVMVTRYIDDARAQKARRLEIFRAMMRTRNAALLPDHVNALNLVEIEFHRAPDVMTAYRELMRHINSGTPVDEKWLQRHRSCLTKVLSAMAKNLGYGFEQLEVFEGGYYPTGWGQTEEQQLAMRLGLIELLSGKRTLPVHVTEKPVHADPSGFQTIADRVTKPPPLPPQPKP
jgi:hypothetical protein